MPNAADKTDESLEWYCLRTQTKREHIAAKILSKIDSVVSFCPRISQVRKTTNGKKRFTEAMFPGYIFAKFSMLENYRRVIHSQGVSKLVELGQRKVVPACIIEDLIASIPDAGIIEAPDLSIEPGAKVEFVSGTLRGLKGEVIAQLPSTERIQILLEFLGREITVASDPADVLLAPEE